MGRLRAICPVTPVVVVVLRLERELKILRIGKVSTGGTHVKANAPIDKNATCKRPEIREQLGRDIDVAQNVASVPSGLGKPEAVLADAGYGNTGAFERLENQGVEVYCSMQSARHYGRRAPVRSGRAVRTVTTPSPAIDFSPIGS